MTRAVRAVVAALVVLLAGAPPVVGQSLLSQAAPKGAAPAAAAPAPPPDALGRQTPSGTVMGFLAAAAKSDWPRAAKYLDTKLPQDRAEELARQLKVLLDRGLEHRPGPAEPLAGGGAGRTARQGPRTGRHDRTKSGKLDVLLARVQRGAEPPVWLFAPETLRDVPAAYEEYEPSFVERFLPDYLTRGYGPQIHAVVVADRRRVVHRRPAAGAVAHQTARRGAARPAPRSSRRGWCGSAGRRCSSRRVWLVFGDPAPGGVGLLPHRAPALRRRARRVAGDHRGDHLDRRQVSRVSRRRSGPAIRRAAGQHRARGDRPPGRPPPAGRRAHRRRPGAAAVGRHQPDARARRPGRRRDCGGAGVAEDAREPVRRDDGHRGQPGSHRPVLPRRDDDGHRRGHRAPVHPDSDAGADRHLDSERGHGDSEHRELRRRATRSSSTTRSRCGTRRRPTSCGSCWPGAGRSSTSTRRSSSATARVRLLRFAPSGLDVELFAYVHRDRRSRSSWPSRRTCSCG